MVLDKQPEEPRETIEMKASKESKQPAPQADSLSDRLQAAIDAAAMQTPQRPARGLEAGAAAAAGVLTAVDEDEEGDEDAPVPNEFQYETEGEEEEE